VGTYVRSLLAMCHSRYFPEATSSQCERSNIEDRPCARRTLPTCLAKLARSGNIGCVLVMIENADILARCLEEGCYVPICRSEKSATIQSCE